MNLKLNPYKLSLTLSSLILMCFAACEPSKNAAHQQERLELNSEDFKYVTQNPAYIVLSKQSTVKPIPSIEQVFQASGIILPDLSKNKILVANFDGRIEKLNIQFDYQYVNKGEPIMEVYSPELNTFISEYQLLLKNNAPSLLLKAAQEKLMLLGIQEFQIHQWSEHPIINNRITIYSPYNGYFILNKSQSNDKSHGSLHKGDYITKGQALFSVNDFRQVWAIVSIPNTYYPHTESIKNIVLQSEIFPEKKITGKVVTREKSFENKTDPFFKLRVSLENPDQQFKINSLVTAEIPLHSSTSLDVPSSAVVRTGKNAFVWKKIDETKAHSHVFQLTQVIISSIHSEIISLNKGVRETDEIALHAGMLTDSETYLTDKK